MIHKLISTIIISLSLIISVSADQNDFDYSEFKKILILDQGRVKPLDTYAKTKLTQISTKSSLNGEDAISWFARVIFTPQKAMDDKIFRITNPNNHSALVLKRVKGLRYSMKELMPSVDHILELARNASKLDKSHRTAADREIISLYENINMYYGITESFFFTIIDSTLTIKDKEIIKQFNFDSTKTYQTLMDIIPLYKSLSKKAMSLHDKSHDEWSENDDKIIDVIQNIVDYTKYYQRLNFSFAIFPSSKNPEDPWNSSIDILNKYILMKEVDLSRLELINQASKAYKAGDSKRFTENLKQFNEKIISQLSEYNYKKRDFEVTYNNLNPFKKSTIFYLAAAILALFSILFFNRTIYWISFSSLAIGVIPHIGGIILRSLITGKAQVSSLYETFIFVSLVCVFTGFILEHFHRKGLGTFAGAISGFIMLMISNRYAADGDTMKVLAAVLDSNFWLSIHVMTIALGYGGCIMAGVIGHIYLLQTLPKTVDTAVLKKTYKMIYGVLAFGLLFTFTGTVLGGIWADQAWGRFWGWDPKENSALVIIIWCSILFHAKKGNMISERSMAIGSIIGTICVMLAWFGVNLLGVGLHSYGFTSGVATTLFMYIAAEIAFLMVISVINMRKQSKLS